MVWQPDYATLAQVKGYLGITDTADDVELATAISAASRAIDRACGRQFGSVAAPEARAYEATFNRHRPIPSWQVQIDDLGSVAGLAVSIGGVAITAPGFTLYPLNALQRGRPYETLVLTQLAEARPTESIPRVDITAAWGWLTIPNTIINACKLQTGRFDARKRSLFGVAGSPNDGSEIRLLAKVDPDVDVMLTEYIRRWGAV
jgi:hypothetical protein